MQRSVSKRTTKSSSLPKTVVNFWLDCLLLLLMVAIFWLTILLRFVFPPGEISDGWKLWGRTFTQWHDLQFGLICVFAFAVLVHVMLHWTWVCGVLTSRILPKSSGEKKVLDDGLRTLYGVGLLIVLLAIMGLGIASATLSIQPPTN